MLIQDHIQTAYDFLDHAGRFLAEGDRLQCSEKLWGAAAHALTVVITERGWRDSSHRDLRNAAERLTEEYNDLNIRAGFLAAQDFHWNFYHGFMDFPDIEFNLPLVRDFVDRILAFTEAGKDGG